MLKAFLQLRRRLLGAGAAGLLVLVASVALVGCGQKEQKWNSTDVTGTGLGSNWSMPDLDGKMRSAADFRGKVVAVYFGYLSCPDACPTMLAQLVQLKEALGADGDKLQVVFISVDPEGDTPELMREYLAAFDPSFIGLRGDAEQLAATAKAFKAYYARVEDKEKGTYQMDHSTGLYLFDRDGNIRLYARSGMATEDLLADIRQLLG